MLFHYTFLASVIAISFQFLTTGNIFKVSAVPATADVQCSQKIEGLETCLERVQKSNEYQLLKQRRSQIWQTCAAKNNNTYHTCMVELQAMETCQQHLHQDAQVQLARKQLLSEFDQCFKQQFPFNPLIALKPPAYGGPLQTPGAMCPQIPIIHPAFMAGLPHGFGQQSAFGAPQSGTQRVNAPSTQRNNQQQQQPPPIQPMGMFGFQCATFMDCVVQSELQLNKEASVTRAAKMVYNAQNKCLGDNVPQYECTPGSPQIGECIAAAHLNFEEVKQNSLLNCLHPQEEPEPEQARPASTNQQPQNSAATGNAPGSNANKQQQANLHRHHHG